MQASEAAPVKRRRGRPPGSRDTKPRVRRSSAEVRAQPKPVKKMKEGQIQSQFISWLETVPAPNMPGGKLGHWAHAVPNGIWIPGEAHTRMRIIVTQRRQGMKKGVPDVTIAFPMHGYHGLYIELKRDVTQLEPARLTDEQKGWLTRLRAVGYYAAMCVGLEEACNTVRRYLDGLPPLPFPWEGAAE